MSMKAARHATSEETRTSFESLGDMVTAMADTIAPPERLSPSEVAAKYRMLQIPGAYSGPYLGDTTPYMAEPLDCIADPTIRSIVFVGGAQCGKALALDTPIPTPDGWTTMGDLKPGDWVLNEKEEPVRVIGVSPVMYNRECFEVVFDDGPPIVADAEHLWEIREGDSFRIARTWELQDGFDVIARHDRDFCVLAVDPVESVPVRCIAVDSPRHLFLAGRAGVPTHNTDSLILNAMLYTIIADPIDTILYQTSQTSAADFSRTRLDRMHRHSPESGARLLPGGNDDTVHAKYYKSGIVINLSWPTINEMSGKPRGRVLLTDYDRMPQDIDGEGSPFDLAQKRTTSFRSKAKTIVESSPGFEVPAGSLWAPKTPHEAPPCGGILALYNRGDKRRYQWQCPDCRAWFEPVFDLLRYNAELPPGEAGKTAQMGCPHCGVLHGPERKYDLNRAGRWVKDGQRLLEDGTLVGEAPANSCASFWLMGAAAAFLPWADLVAKYLTAEEEYRRTGSQEALKTTVNTDQSMPYRRRGKTVDRLPEELRSRADTWLKGTVPADVRFLVATADVQGKKFVVQVHGIAPGSPYTVVVIDRFDIAKSERRDADGERMPLEPAAYPEDWRLLDEVVEREYPLESGAGHMRIKMLACDSGGQEGTTTRAYGYWLDLRREGSGLHRRFQLLKGDATPAAPRARIGYPDASKRDKNSPLRGDVPVLFLASNVLKDTLDGMLNRPDAIRFPEWMTDEFFMEMCVEVRTEKGWQNPHRRRNETWDLLYYCLGLCVHLGVEHIDWSAPPGWASPQAENPLVRIQANAPAKFAASTTPTRDLRALARALAG